MTYPYGITHAEARAIRALIQWKHAKVGAEKLGISRDAFACRLRNIRRRMKAEGLYDHVLLWDRWEQAQLRQGVEHGPL